MTSTVLYSAVDDFKFQFAYPVTLGFAADRGCTMGVRWVYRSNRKFRYQFEHMYILKRTKHKTGVGPSKAEGIGHDGHRPVVVKM
jgi:hypothetical protein